MAITLTQYPDVQINAGNNDILYVMTSNSSSESNYQFFCDIIDKDLNRQIRIKQRPNPSGVGVFNLGQIVYSTLGSDNVYPELKAFSNNQLFAWGNNGFIPYQIRFGEEWSATPTSPVVQYDGINDVVLTANDTGSVRAGNLTGDDWFNYFVPISVDRKFESDNEWDYDSHYGANSGTKFVKRNALTNMPDKGVKIRRFDVHAVGIPDGNQYEGNFIANDISQIVYRLYDASDNLMTTFNEYNWSYFYGGNAPLDAVRLNAGYIPNATLYANYYEPTTNPDYQQRIIYANAGLSWETSFPNVARYEVDFTSEYFQGIGLDFQYQNYEFIIQDDNCPYPIYRLMWKNPYGVWDFFNFEGRNRQSITRTDNQFTKGFIDYSIPLDTTNPWNTENRGITNYQSKYKENITLTTGWLTQEWADWLQELFESPEVYLLDDTYGSIPIVLNSATYNKLNDPRTEKNRSYNIEFSYANPKRPRK